VVTIDVRDYGIGMTEEQVSHIFERFYRAEKSGQVPGSGLGMSLVKEIVTILGWSVSIDSELGQGTRVTLSIPIAISH
jgi:signal transduction histidine kinase